jgi:hypothetical protein
MSAVECEHLFCGMDDISISKRNLLLLKSLQPKISDVAVNRLLLNDKSKIAAPSRMLL